MKLHNLYALGLFIVLLFPHGSHAKTKSLELSTKDLSEQRKFLVEELQALDDILNPQDEEAGGITVGAQCFGGGKAEQAGSKECSSVTIAGTTIETCCPTTCPFVCSADEGGGYTWKKDGECYVKDAKACVSTVVAPNNVQGEY